MTELTDVSKTEHNTREKCHFKVFNDHKNRKIRGNCY